MVSPAFLTEARKTLLLAVPIMAGQLSQMLMGVLDSAMVGRVGVIPLAASAFANGLLACRFFSASDCSRQYPCVSRRHMARVIARKRVKCCGTVSRLPPWPASRSWG